MVFVLTLEEGTGLDPDANSYVSREAATDYFAIDSYFNPVWSALTTSVQDALLGWSTRVLDQKVQWRGNKAVETSPLRWPRAGVYDRDGLAIEENVVPLQVVQATLELAKYLKTNDLTTGQDIDYLKMIRVDVIELQYQDKVGQPTLPSILNDILQPLGGIPTGGSRFVKIVKV